uniref:Cyclic nucleotide-binding domain-containing protein n=1 Tax=Oryza brachyantha TaxID=4533 RepID=J3M8J1_ORYBR
MALPTQRVCVLLQVMMLLLGLAEAFFNGARAARVPAADAVLRHEGDRAAGVYRVRRGVARTTGGVGVVDVPEHVAGRRPLHVVQEHLNEEMRPSFGGGGGGGRGGGGGGGSGGSVIEV